MVIKYIFFGSGYTIIFTPGFLLFKLTKADQFMKNEGNDDNEMKVMVFIFSLYGLTAYCSGSINFCDSCGTFIKGKWYCTMLRVESINWILYVRKNNPKNNPNYCQCMFSKVEWSWMNKCPLCKYEYHKKDRNCDNNNKHLILDMINSGEQKYLPKGFHFWVILC